MVGTTCTICLDDVKSPVSIPCGHLHCEGCLVQYVEQHDEVAEAPCPTCRAPFCIATPDLRFVPQKYHKYMIPTVRRVYLSQPAANAHPESVAHLKSVISDLEDRTETLEHTNGGLRSRVATLEKRVTGLNQDKERLMDRCEAGMANIRRLGEQERDARQDKERLEKELEALRHKYESVKVKYKTLKHTKPPVPQPRPIPVASTKRTSAQAALDVDVKPGDNQGPGTRPILPIPKRPRMNFSGWRPAEATREAPSEPSNSLANIKEEEREMENDNSQAKMEEEDVKPPMPSLSSISSHASNSPFSRAKREIVPPPSIHSTHRHFSQSPQFMRKFSDMETDDDDDDVLPLPRIPKLDVTGQSNKPFFNRQQKLKPSGLSRVFQSMDVDDSDHSPSTSNSSPHLPTPGPSSRPHLPPPSFMKPARSGLAVGDLFSPRRSSPGKSYGSIDYASSPIRVSTYDEDEEDEQTSVAKRSYVFRGKKISAVLDHSVWGTRS